MNKKLEDYIIKKYGKVNEFFRFDDCSYVVKAGKLNWILDIKPVCNIGKIIGYELVDNDGHVSTMYVEGGNQND